MGKAHEVAIGMDGREFDEGVRHGIIKPIEEAARALDDLGGDGARDVGKLEDAIKDAQDQTKKLDRSVEQVGDGTRKSFGKASDNVGEFKDEAKQNFSEITSSFDGSMESISELAQGTLGGLASSLPGIGAAAGIAALGIGAITEELTNTAERSKEIKEGIIQDFVEIGDALDKEAVDARVRDILNAEGTRKEAQLLADIMGITVGQAVLAMAGDFESAGVTVDQVMDGINNASGSVDTKVWSDLKNTVDSTTDAMEAGREAAAARAEAEKRTAATVETEQKKQQDAIAKTAEKLMGFPAERDARVKIYVDDSNLTNYRPPTIRVNAVIGNPSLGGRGWQ
jgi:phage-related protein